MEKMNTGTEKMDRKMDARNKTIDDKMDARDERMNEKMDVKINKQSKLTERFLKDVEANKNEITEIQDRMNERH